MRAGGWVLAGYGGNQLIRLGSNLVMTRLLVPEMFGLMAVAWLFMTGLQLVSDMGLRQSIVRSQRADDPVFRGTAWSLQIIRGGLLWLCGLMIAGAIYGLQQLGYVPDGTVYADPALAAVIAVLSTVALVSGFESTRMALAERNLAQNFVVRLELTGVVSGAISMILWALIDQSIWALVAGGLVAAITRVVLSHVWLPGASDSVIWDRATAAELFGFGKWVFLTSTLGFAVSSGDRLLLGGLVSPQQLGLYAIAFLIADAVSQIVSKLLGAVSFPAFSEVARLRPEELINVYYKFRLPIDVVALLACGALFVGGSVVVDVLFDDRYVGAGTILEVLAVSLFFVRFGVAEMLCLVLNKPHSLSVQVAARAVVLYVFVPVCYLLYGFMGAIWVVALHRAASLLPMTIFLIQHRLFDPKKEITAIPALLVGLALGAIAKQLYLA